jgi:hypothetical protein
MTGEGSKKSCTKQWSPSFCCREKNPRLMGAQIGSRVAQKESQDVTFKQGSEVKLDAVIATRRIQGGALTTSESGKIEPSALLAKFTETIIEERCGNLAGGS